MADLIARESTENARMRDILKRVRLIEIRSRRTVSDIMAGEYHSVFKGRGMEFDEVREYAPGDEIRDIDWNVTARTGHAFVKRYVEEREQTVFFVADVSGSAAFGTQGALKSEVAAEICALLAFSAVQNNDRVGLLRFSDRVEELIPPRKGRKHVLRVVRQILFAGIEGVGTDLALAVDTLNRILPRRAIIFLVSDFLTGGLKESLMRVNRRHDVVAISLRDPREEDLPRAGIVELLDAETGRRFEVDTSDAAVRRRFAEAGRARSEQLDRSLRRLGIDHVPIATGESYLDPLVRYFRMRARRV